LFHFQGTRYDNNWPQFSPDGRYLVAWDAVYEVATGETVFELVNGNYGQWRFSPDGSLLAVGAEAVYEVATGERLLTIEGFSTRFSVDGRLLAVDEVVYEVGTWEPYEGTLAEGIPSPDGTMTVLWDEGLYDAANGQMIFAVPAGEGQTHNRVGAFSPDQTLLIVNFWGTCLLYDSEGYPWSYRSGLVDTQGEVLEFSAGDGMPVQDVTGLLVVMARSPDDPWLRVRYPDSFVYRLSLEGWIAADEVAIVALPDGVPVETPVGQSQTDRQ